MTPTVFCNYIKIIGKARDAIINRATARETNLAECLRVGRMWSKHMRRESPS